MELLKAAGANVLLTGSGGDEMVWGHSLTYGSRLLRGDLRAVWEVISGCREMQLPLLQTLLQVFVKPFIPESVKNGIRGFRGSPSSSRLPPWIPATTVKRLNLEERLFGKSSTQFKNPALQARHDALARTSTINSVRSYQQAGLAYGIDVRHPFFDRRLAEFSFAIPDDLWIRDNYPKWLLRKTMDGRLPDSVCWNRQKVTFDRFFGKLIRDQSENIRAILSDTRLQDMGLLDNARLLKAFDDLVKGEPALNVDLLYVLMGQIWFQKYADLFEAC
ncbi:hypothetical protein QQ73_02325 [Candidatus Endoriftia persephone str. Guaymas]|nr:hypothetical protein [Candidatus Endoriftia persephone str. Guaymas]